MKYQISYLSPNGYAESIADAYWQTLPRGSGIFDLEAEDAVYAETQLVGFELGGTKLDAIPFTVLEYLEKLDGKQIFLFATVPFLPNESVVNRVNNSLIPFLPDACDYRGLYLCPAEPPEDLIRDLRNVLAAKPDNDRVRHLLGMCEAAKGHPSEDDLKRACLQMRRVLEL